MINYINKGRWLHQAITVAGHVLVEHNRVWQSDDDAAVQTIIDNFDPLPYARADALARIKQAAADKYAQYATQAPGKDAVYAAKQTEAEAHYNAGANDGPVGPYLQARMTRTGETANAISAEWRAKAAAWTALAAAIDAAQDHATAQINAATDWTAIDGLAGAAIAEIEALG